MKIFGRDRESLRIKKVKASRAVFVSPDVQEIEIRFMTEQGDILALQLPSRLAPALVNELTTAHEAIHPSMQFGRGQRYSTWDGMRDDN